MTNVEVEQPSAAAEESASASITTAATAYASAAWDRFDEWVINAPDGNEKNDFNSSETVVTVARDILPSCGKAAATQSLQFVNQTGAVIFVSHLLGSSHLGPFTVAVSFFNACGASILVGLATASESMAAQAHGADPEGVHGGVAKIAQFSLVVMWVLCVPLSLFFIFCEPIVTLIFGNELGPAMEVFLRYAAPFYLLMFGTRAVFNRCLVATKRPEIPLRSQIVACIVFPVYAVLLIRGVWPSIASAGFALCAAVLTQISVMVYLGWTSGDGEEEKAGVSGGQAKQEDGGGGGADEKKPARTFIRQAVWTVAAVSETLTRERFDGWAALALPACASVLASWWAQELLLFLAAGLGPIKVAALSVVLNLTLLLFILQLGFSMGIASAVGNRLGANDASGARAAARVSVLLGLGLALITGLIVYIFGHYIFLVYSTDERILVHIRPLLPLTAVFTMAEQMAICVGGVFRGAAQQQMLAGVTTVTQWTVGVLGMLIARFVFRAEIAGLMTAFLLGFLVQLPLLAYRIHNFDWVALAKEASEKHSQKQKEPVVGAQQQGNNEEAATPSAAPAEE